MLPQLGTLGTSTNIDLMKIYKEKTILFSAKNNNKDESQYLLSQLKNDSVIINILHSKYMNIVNSTNGGMKYLNNKLMFILVPREKVIEYNSYSELFISLHNIQKKKPKLSSNRGKNHTVYFESDHCNYVDLGVGACRSMPGLYKKVIHGLESKYMIDVEKYFDHIRLVTQKFLPQCLIDTLNIAFKNICLEDLSSLNTYAENKIYYESTSKSQHSNNCSTNDINYSFMPSASYGANNLLPLHTDKDMFLSIVHLHCHEDVSISSQKSKYNLESNIVKYFSFTDGTSVALRSGDLLIFNPTIPHCVSSCTDKYKNKRVYCVSHYFKTLIASRNNNKIIF